MIKTKVVNNRVINVLSTKEVLADRTPSVYLSRLPQQNVREGEFLGNKLKNTFASPVTKTPFTLATNTGATVTVTLTANDGQLILAFPQINLYVDVTEADPDYLWPTGTALTSAQKNLQLGFMDSINTNSLSEVNGNEWQTTGIVTNRDSSSHDYLIVTRHLYTILEN